MSRTSPYPKEAFGSLDPTLSSIEDHGPYYIYSPGEPVHRVEYRDGLPHLYPGLVHRVGSFLNWYTEQLLESSSITARNTSGEKVNAHPHYAGAIKYEICDGPSGYRRIGVVSVKALDKMDDFAIAEFNKIIMPDAAWFNADEVPVERLTEWRERSIELTRECEELGALEVRRRWLESATDRVPKGHHQATKFREAIRECLAAVVAYRRLAESYMEDYDKQVINNKIDGYYQREDLLRWLLARPDVQRQARAAPVINVAAPDVAGIAAAAAREAVTAAMAGMRERDTEPAPAPPSKSKS